MEQVKCPECGGTKCTALNNETYRCLYCGATIKVKPEAEVRQTVQQATQSVAQQPQVVVQVQVPQQPVQPQYTQQPEQQQEEIKKGKGKWTYVSIFFYIFCGIFLWDIGLINIKDMIIMSIVGFTVFIYYMYKTMN